MAADGDTAGDVVGVADPGHRPAVELADQLECQIGGDLGVAHLEHDVLAFEQRHLLLLVLQQRRRPLERVQVVLEEALLAKLPLVLCLVGLEQHRSQRHRGGCHDQ